MSPQIEIQIIAIAVAVACAIPGTFLVLRKMSMMSDSITHTILLGIVLAFFVTHNLSSPLLIAGAALMGVITVWLTETLSKTRLLSEDSAIGLVFPLLFSIAVILISRYAGSVHLDTDSVLLGELAFAPFDRMVINGVDIGAKAIYTSLGLMVLNLAAVIIFFKELKAAAFDPMLAAVLGFSPVLVHYGLMTAVSLTAVGAFQAVGSVLVVAFMIGPPVTAYLLTDNLKTMLVLSTIFGALSGILGYRAASLLDVSIAGSMAVTIGLIFMAVFICSPKKGLVNSLLRRKRQRLEFAKMTLLFHLYSHPDCKNENSGCKTDLISLQFGWDKAFSDKIIRMLSKEGNIEISSGLINLTEKGIDQSVKNYNALFSKTFGS